MTIETRPELGENLAVMYWLIRDILKGEPPPVIGLDEMSNKNKEFMLITSSADMIAQIIMTVSKGDVSEAEDGIDKLVDGMKSSLRKMNLRPLS